MITEILEKTGEASFEMVKKIPVLRRLVSARFPLKSFVCVAVLIVSCISFSGMYLVVSSIYQRSFIRNADEVSDEVAQQLFNSMFQLMVRGWTRKELTQFLGAVEGVRPHFPYKAEIFRGKAVEKVYGRIKQPRMDRFVRDSFRSGRTLAYRAGSLVINLYPLKADSRCLKCHANARTGEVLGELEIRQDISPAIKDAKRKFDLLFFMLLPIPFIMAGAVSTFLNAKLKRSVGCLHDKASEINSVGDLTKLNNLDCQETGFIEFNAILNEFTGFAKKIRTVAVDREVLEFELRLLERFIITSDVVSNWKEHVMQLLLEINKVIPVYVLFSIFQIEDELCDLEVFWTLRPPEDIKGRVVELIRDKIRVDNPDLLRTTLKSNHTIADIDHPVAVTAEEIQLQAKSLVLQKPSVVGIVGIGIRPETTKDTVRSLVVDGILTTVLNVVGSIEAIYEHTRKLEYFAMRDPLTSLYNQRIFWELLGYEIGRAKRHSQNFALLVVDIDNFKSINDAHGHNMGDQFLCGITRVFRSSLRAGDILARYGGDEFTVVLPDADVDQAYLVANRMLEAAGAFALTLEDGRKIRTGVSIGFAVYPVHAINAKDMFTFADNMMYKAKSEGKNTVTVPTEEDVVELFRAFGEKTAIVMRAIDEKAVIPFFQPIVDVGSGEVIGHEVLSRLETAAGIWDAKEFIEVAERFGGVPRLDYVVMEKVFGKVKAEGYERLLFINLSPKSLILRDFIPGIIKLTRQYEINPGNIVFEITERETVRNLSLLEKFVHGLKVEGFKFAIDDFGSGFAQFNYIKRFPVDFIKIEGEFIRNMIHDRKDLALVKTMAKLAQEFSIGTIAECVEDEEILTALEPIGIRYGQGYHISTPAPEFKTDTNVMNLDVAQEHPKRAEGAAKNVL